MVKSIYALSFFVAASLFSGSSVLAQDVGVASCDAFFATYEACIKDKIPAANQDMARSGMAQARAGLKSLADNPQTKPSVAAACDKMAAQMKAAAVAAYGCAF